jgi:hypothetical protein
MNANENKEVPDGAGASGGPGNRTPVLRLTLESIGPLSKAEIELIRGLTVLYGLNVPGAGKTTIARVLWLLTRLNMGVADVKDVTGLVNRTLRYMDPALAEKEGSFSRIVYDMDGTSLEIRYVPTSSGIKLKVGDWERRIDANERLPMIDKPRIALVWVTHDAVMLFGFGEQSGWPYGLDTMTIDDLLTPSVYRDLFRGLVAAGAHDDIMELYEEALSKVNNMLEATTDYRIEYRDGIYFKNGIHVYTLDEVSSGVKRFALIYLAKVLAKQIAELTKIEPVLFIENLEDSLDVTMVSGIIENLRTSDMISVAETHSGFPLRAAVMRKQMNYYVFIDGKVTKDLKPEVFKMEIAEWSDVDTY